VQHCSYFEYSIIICREQLTLLTVHFLLRYFEFHLYSQVSFFNCSIYVIELCFCSWAFLFHLVEEDLQVEKCLVSAKANYDFISKIAQFLFFFMK